MKLKLSNLDVKLSNTSLGRLNINTLNNNFIFAEELFQIFMVLHRHEF